MTHWLISMGGTNSIADITDNNKYIQRVDAIYKDGCDFNDCDTIKEFLEDPPMYQYNRIVLDDSDSRYIDLMNYIKLSKRIGI